MSRDLFAEVGAILTEMGGPGSGHFRHAGRKGKRGGSIPSRASAYKTFQIWDSRNIREFMTRSRITSPSSGMKQSVGHYAGDGYISINETLRRGEEPSEEMTQHVKNLDKFVETGALAENVTLYRGVHPKAEISKRFGSLKGKTIRDNGFSSTTLDQSEGTKFAGYYSPQRYHGVLMEIRAPKGTPAGIMLGPEHEVLLGRGTRFKVLKEVTTNIKPVTDSLGKVVIPGYTEKRLVVGVR